MVVNTMKWNEWVLEFGAEICISILFDEIIDTEYMNEKPCPRDLANLYEESHEIYKKFI